MKKKFDYLSLISGRQKLALRDGFGQAMADLIPSHPKLYLTCADLDQSLKLTRARELAGPRFIQMGVAEQNMASFSAGLAMAGKTVVASSFASFNPGRNWDQIRVSICYPNLDVKIVGGHAGLMTGQDGATHQALEDLALMRVLPNMKVLVPADSDQAYQASMAMVESTGPCYLRLGREKLPIINYPNPFVFGQAQFLARGEHLTIINSGELLGEVIQASHLLQNLGISSTIINLPTLKPLDHQSIVSDLIHTGYLLTVENHQLMAGVGSAVLESLNIHHPYLPKFQVGMIGVVDSFGESGTAGHLIDKYHLNTSAIFNKALELLGVSASKS